MMWWLVLLAVFLGAAVAEAQPVPIITNPEPICPGGSAPATGVFLCPNFDGRDNCVTGFESQCWVNEGYSHPSLRNQKVAAPDAAVGTGYASQSLIPPGATSAGEERREPLYPGAAQGDPKPTTLRYRFYVRYRGGFVSMPSGHSFGVEALSADGACGGSIKWQGSTFSNEMHYDGPSGCGAGMDSLFFTPNVQRIPILNNRWTMVEVRADLESVCTNQTTAPWSGCNGLVQAWVDGVMTHNYPGLNLGKLQGEANGHANVGWYLMAMPGIFYHYGLPPWPSIMEVDNIVFSTNSSVAIGPAANENTRGTGDAASPYAAIAPYWAFLGRHAAGDYSCNGDFGEYNGGFYRGGNLTLDPTTFHGSYVNNGATTIGNMGELTGAGHCNTLANTLFTVSDGNNGAADGSVMDPQSPGSAQRNIRWDGAVWRYTTNTDNSMKVTVPGSNKGGGGFHERQSGVAFNTWASKGFVRLSSANNYNSTAPSARLALTGFAGANNETSGYVALTVVCANPPACSDLRWGISQTESGDINYAVITSSATAALDTWTEYQVMIFKDGSFGCSSNGNGCVTLMINGQQPLVMQPL